LGRFERQLGQLVDQLCPGAVVNLKQFRKAHPQLPVPTPLIQSRPFERQRLQILFAHCPNPHDLLARSDQAILALYRSNGGRAGPALLRDLRAWGQNAVLLPPAVAQPLAEHLKRLFGHYTRAQTLIADARQRLVPLMPLTPARHLLAIPGLGPTDAAAYLAALGSPHRFQRAAEVWAFASFDPIPTGSGDKPDRVGQISKHGDPTRRWLPRTPAMVAGLTDHIWSVKELLQTLPNPISTNT
jgi:transposase